MAQRAPLTQAEKQMISQKKATGESLVEISRAMHCSYETVRKWWRIARDQRQVRARGRPKRGPLSTYPSPSERESDRTQAGACALGTKADQAGVAESALVA